MQKPNRTMLSYSAAEIAVRLLTWVPGEWQS